MCKVLVLVLLLSVLNLVLSISPTEEQNISPEQDAEIQRLSDFFIDLVNKYDKTGNGLIKKSVYPMFLRDIFLKGSFGDQDSNYKYTDLLLQATTQFTKTKEDKTDKVSVQQLYDDIISKFTLFLMQKKQYNQILQTLFEDLQQNTKKGQSKFTTTSNQPEHENENENEDVAEEVQDL